jgi:hypothetical protein
VGKTVRRMSSNVEEAAGLRHACRVFLWMGLEVNASTSAE